MAQMWYLGGLLENFYLAFSRQNIKIDPMVISCIQANCCQLYFLKGSQSNLEILKSIIILINRRTKGDKSLPLLLNKINDVEQLGDLMATIVSS
jgi:hypothetical protein